MSAIATENAPAAPQGKKADVVLQIRTGDREAAARFLLEHEGLIRRRYRQRLGRLRNLLDSQDLLSTLARRLDAFVHGRQVEATTLGQLLALIFQIGDHAFVDKSRVFARLQKVEGPDSLIAQEWRCRLARAERSRPDGANAELDRMFVSLVSDTDRQILALWMAGEEHPEIATQLGLSHAATRQRWARICDRLRAKFPGRDA